MEERVAVPLALMANAVQFRIHVALFVVPQARYALTADALPPAQMEWIFLGRPTEP